MTHALLVSAARWMVASLFLISGAMKMADFGPTRALMVRYRFPMPSLALMVAIGVELGCGLLLGLGLSIRLTAAVLVVYVAAASVMIPVKQLWEPDQRKQAVLTLSKNMAIVGALVRFYVG